MVLRTFISLKHSFKNQTGHRLGKGNRSLGHWSNHWVTGRTAWKNRMTRSYDPISIKFLSVY